MSTFTFGFNLGSGAATDPKAPDSGRDAPADTPLKAAVEVWAPVSHDQPTAVCSVDLGDGRSMQLTGVSSAQAGQLLDEAEAEASDLLPGRYEGGLKLWESAVDLARLLLQRFEPASSPLAMRVIELGCGHGLPGITCARLLPGAELVFQDYNAEALSSLTAPNLRLNVSKAAAEKARYFAGDWASLGPLLASIGLANSFDLVLSAETIYSQASMQALYACIKQCIKPGGTAYIAAKSMYFGLDGGTLPFRRLVEQDEGAVVQVVSEVREGVFREILQLQFDQP